LAGESRGVHEVAEHDGELPTFGFRRGRGHWCGLALRRRDVRHGRRKQGRGRGRGAGRPPGPGQGALILIHCEVFGVDQVAFEGFQVVVIELKLELESTIRDTALALQQIDDLRTEGREVHQRPSTCASAAPVWGSQKVMSIDVYISMAVDSSA